MGCRWSDDGKEDVQVRLDMNLVFCVVMSSILSGEEARDEAELGVWGS